MRHITEHPHVRYPDGAPPPDGWRWGAHVTLPGSRTGYFLYRETDEATVVAVMGPDLAAEDAPDGDELAAAIREHRRVRLEDVASLADHELRPALDEAVRTIRESADEDESNEALLVALRIERRMREGR